MFKQLVKLILHPMTPLNLQDHKEEYEISQSHLTLQELKALLVENLNKLRLKILIAIPGASCHRSVRLQVVQHVDFLL